MKKKKHDFFMSWSWPFKMLGTLAGQLPQLHLLAAWSLGRRVKRVKKLFCALDYCS